MKNSIICLFTLVVVVCISQAAILQVSKSGFAPYTEVQPAINAASAGDTILIASSPASYSGFTVDRELYIVGAGTDTAYSQSAVIGGQVVLESGATGTVLRGLFVYRNIAGTFDQSRSVVAIRQNCGNTTIQDCIIKNEATSEQYYVSFPIVVWIDGPNTSVLFLNSVLWGNTGQYYHSVHFGLVHNPGTIVTLVGCILTGSWTEISGGDATSILTISNCLFHANAIAVGDASDGSMVNSASIQGNHDVGSNMMSMYCMAASGSDFVEYSNDADPRIDNFELSAGSTLRDAGNPDGDPDTDGSRADIGIYGGRFPYRNGIPAYPFVIGLEVSPVVPQNGVLHIGSRGRVGQGGGQ